MLARLRGTVKAFFDSAEAAFKVLEVVLPEPNDSPALRTQLSFHAPVSARISLKLQRPKTSIGCRLPSVLGTSVPEAAVHEDGEAGAWEDEVGAAW